MALSESFSEEESVQIDNDDNTDVRLIDDDIVRLMTTLVKEIML